MPTKIEWATDTWNPITGCTKISEGCQNCYARRVSSRLRGRFGYDKDEPFRVTLHLDKLEQPLKWRKPRRVFVCSMGDLFHPDVPEIEILKIFGVMAETPQHTYMVLTKRPKRMKEVLTSPTVANDVWLMTSRGCTAEPSPWPLPNVWLGVTAENQARADERIPVLLQISAAVRFVSVEPMLGPVDLTFDVGTGMGHRDSLLNYGIDWVICGGETGPGARPMHPEWVRSVRDQCRDAGVPFFFKQWGEWNPDNKGICRGIRTQKLEGVVLYRIGKKAAGRSLDGEAWDEMPEGRMNHEPF